MRKLLLALCIAAIAGSASAASDIVVSDSWSRATPAGATSAVVYFTVTDTDADKLIGASTPIAAKAELHQTTMENGIMKMVPISGGIVIDGDHPFKASPNGYHLMLTGLKQPLKSGDNFPLTLTFEKGGQVSTNVKVRPSVMDSMPGMKMPGMKMDGMDMTH